MKKALKWLDVNFEPLIVVSIFITMSTLVTLQVILRFFFKSGFAWGEELSRYMFVWLVFSGLSYAVRNNRQISVNYLRNILSERGQKIIMLIVDLLFLFFILVIFRWTIAIVLTTAKYGDKAVSLPISQNYMFFAAVSGTTLMIVRTLQTFIWKIRRFKKSLTLFSNVRGLYSGVSTIFFMPKEYRAELEDLIDDDVLKEERGE